MQAWDKSWAYNALVLVVEEAFDVTLDLDDIGRVND